MERVPGEDADEASTDDPAPEHIYLKFNDVPGGGGGAGPAAACADTADTEEPQYDIPSQLIDDSEPGKRSSLASQPVYERPRSAAKSGGGSIGSGGPRASALYAYISESSTWGSNQTISSLHVGGAIHISSPTMDAGFRARLSSLSKMLEDEDGVESLVGFAAKCYILEYVLFWLDCEQFRNFDGTFEDLKSYAELIARK